MACATSTRSSSAADSAARSPRAGWPKAGYRVLVLERGRRWNPTNFPREPTDPWVWDDRPASSSATAGSTSASSRNMSVVQGAGVGGGSLVYANISIDAKPDTFDAGWPPEITFDELQDRTTTGRRRCSNVKPVPDDAVARADQAAEGGRGRSRVSATIPAARARGAASTTTGPTSSPDPHATSHSRRSARTRRAEAGHLRAPRQLRHRLRRQRAQHARSELPARCAEDARRRDPAAAHRAADRASRAAATGRLRRDRRRSPRR